MLVFALAIAFVTLFVFALVPAIVSSRPDLTAALKETGRGGGREGRTLSALVVAQVALASLLLTGSGLLIEGRGDSESTYGLRAGRRDYVLGPSAGIALRVSG